MFAQKLFKAALLAVITVGFLASCKKEEVLAPNENTENKTVIFIRAVDKDSSVVESEQLLLR